jgi:hypothetical protein
MNHSPFCVAQPGRSSNRRQKRPAQEAQQDDRAVRARQAENVENDSNTTDGSYSKASKIFGPTEEMTQMKNDLAPAMVKKGDQLDANVSLVILSYCLS